MTASVTVQYHSRNVCREEKSRYGPDCMGRRSRCYWLSGGCLCRDPSHFVEWESGRYSAYDEPPPRFLAGDQCRLTASFLRWCLERSSARDDRVLRIGAQSLSLLTE